MDRREFLLAAAATPVALALGPGASAQPLGGLPLAFVTADLDSHVAVVDPMTFGVVARITTLPGPRSIESIGGRTALVAHTKLGKLSLIDPGTLRLRVVVAGFREPRYTAARPSSGSGLAYVTDSALGQVVTVDVIRGSVVARADVPGPARHVTITPDGGSIWTALGSKADRIAVLEAREARRPRLVRTIAPPFLAHDVVAAPDGSHIWVTAGDARRVAVFDRAGRTLDVIPAGSPPQHIAFAGELVFVACGDDGTVRVHRQDGKLLHEAAVPVGSYNVAFGGGHAVTPSLERGTVSILDERGRVRAVHRIARAAHDACVVLAT